LTCEPGLQLAHHEGLRQVVEVAAHRGFRQSQRARRIGRIPHLAVHVGQHAPEAQHRRGRHVDAVLRKIGFDQPLDRVDAPSLGIDVFVRQEGQRIAPAQPQVVL
jgi:hypothetical protein